MDARDFARLAQWASTPRRRQQLAKLDFKLAAHILAKFRAHRLGGPAFTSMRLTMRLGANFQRGWDWAERGKPALFALAEEMFGPDMRNYEAVTGIPLVPSWSAHGLRLHVPNTEEIELAVGAVAIMLGRKKQDLAAQLRRSVVRVKGLSARQPCPVCQKRGPGFSHLECRLRLRSEWPQ